MTRKVGVLVVDDNDDIREMIGELLMIEGYHSIIACSGQEALRKIESVRPDIVVTDLAMQGLSGAEFLAALVKAQGATPAVMITASQRHVAEAALAAAGVRATVVSKPFAVNDLLEALRAHLR